MNKCYYMINFDVFYKFLSFMILCTDFKLSKLVLHNPVGIPVFSKKYLPTRIFNFYVVCHMHEPSSYVFDRTAIRNRRKFIFPSGRLSLTRCFPFIAMGREGNVKNRIYNCFESFFHSSVFVESPLPVTVWCELKKSGNA